MKRNRKIVIVVLGLVLVGVSVLGYAFRDYFSEENKTLRLLDSDDRPKAIQEERGGQREWRLDVLAIYEDSWPPEEDMPEWYAPVSKDTDANSFIRGVLGGDQHAVPEITIVDDVSPGGSGRFASDADAMVRVENPRGVGNSGVGYEIQAEHARTITSEEMEQKKVYMDITITVFVEPDEAGAAPKTSMTYTERHMALIVPENGEELSEPLP